MTPAIAGMLGVINVFRVTQIIGDGQRVLRGQWSVQHERIGNSSTRTAQIHGTKVPDTREHLDRRPQLRDMTAAPSAAHGHIGDGGCRYKASSEMNAAALNGVNAYSWSYESGRSGCCNRSTTPTYALSGFSSTSTHTHAKSLTVSTCAGKSMRFLKSSEVSLMAASFSVGCCDPCR